ncbi:hypothetical protein SAMN02799630_05652 [Paenibacillus sp. UNCCL117]|uniref:hypothetical protein n=1 Tax=unclassified Paenibacillus TaxID=185978 RepID=UPI0008854AAD|nr:MULTISPECIES: hypothetical protein [unclassified Paenibacillus]SDD62427.1 hypothetical protein SAMN04488602_11125 [Paenibacillus sp. cl123]SFW67640.1 hypothetical protein SAMN02799630_05652 [Paenibacillus sp. UNCCL117]
MLTSWAGLKARVGLGCLALLLVLPGYEAQAGIIDRVKDIYGMPEQVGQLQEQYEDTKRQLEQSRQQMEEAMARSEEAARSFQETQDKLLRENEELKMHNTRLEQTLRQLEEARYAQSVRNRQIAWTALTAAGLALLYFALTRMVRFALWRRGRGGMPGGPE